MSRTLRQLDTLAKLPCALSGYRVDPAISRKQLCRIKQDGSASKASEQAVSLTI